MASQQIIQNKYKLLKNKGKIQSVYYILINKKFILIKKGKRNDSVMIFIGSKLLKSLLPLVAVRKLNEC